MARNEEKNYTALNRLYLEKQREEREKKHPKRPPLSTLATASEVKRWIPNIKAEINFCLHHLSGVRNYSDLKIKEFKERLERLEIEHKRWKRRVLELDPSERYVGVPGEPHAYINKRKMEEIKAKASKESTHKYYNYMNAGAAVTESSQQQWDGWSQTQWEDHWASQIEEEEEEEEEEGTARDDRKRKMMDKELNGIEKEDDQEEEGKISKKMKIETPLLALLEKEVPPEEGVLVGGEGVVEGEGCPAEGDNNEPLQFNFGKATTTRTTKRSAPATTTTTTTTTQRTNTKRREEDDDDESDGGGLGLLSGYTSD